MNENSISLRRHGLYELVWSEPITRLAKKYGFSDVWLAKICKKYNIPRPGRGYWARKKAGERVPITRLPKPTDNPLIEIITHTEKPKTSREHRSNPFVDRIPRKIVVPVELTEPHALIKETTWILASSRENDSGILTPSKGGGLDVRVSKECYGDDLELIVRALVIVGRQKLLAFHEQGLEVFSFGILDVLLTLYRCLPVSFKALVQLLCGHDLPVHLLLVKVGKGKVDAASEFHGIGIGIQGGTCRSFPACRASHSRYSPRCSMLKDEVPFLSHFNSM